MGNRSNIRVDFHGATPIYLYSHWDGERVIESAVERAVGHAGYAA